MTRIVNKGPLQRLKHRVAQPATLRAMSASERRAGTCKVCDITYTSSSDAQACMAWHKGEGR